MSHLLSECIYDLSKGLTWAAVLTIAATAQPRRKVIIQFSAGDNKGPGLTLQLDYFDHLSVVIKDNEGSDFQTPRIAPESFANCFIRLHIEAHSSLGKTNVAVYINGEQLSAAEFEAEASREVLSGYFSFGADETGQDPATFGMKEAVQYEKIMPPWERKRLDAYFFHRHHLWGDDATIPLPMIGDEEARYE